MTSFHPTLVSNKLVRTVNFYEDYFGFVPTIEKDGYVLMQSEDHPDSRLAIFDSTHKCVSENAKPVQGLILSIGVDNVQEKYDSLYMEGVDIYKDLGEDIHGQKHFVVCDPNGVLVDVHGVKTDDGGVEL